LNYYFGRYFDRKIQFS